MNLSYWQRRLTRHLLLAVISVALMLVIYSTLSSADGFFKWSMASAYTSLTLLVISLLFGPLNVLRNRPNPVSTNLRRDVGIWAGILGLFHTVVGLQVHLGNFWLYFFFPPGSPSFLALRYDVFGIANFTGLGATLVLMLLLALSNNLSLRRLGPTKWKNLQRWNYAAFVLIVLHGVVYQVLEKREVVFVGLFCGIVLLAVVIQFAGYRTRRAQESRVMSPDRGQQA